MTCMKSRNEFQDSQNRYQAVYSHGVLFKTSARARVPSNIPFNASLRIIILLGREKGRNLIHLQHPPPPLRPHLYSGLKVQIPRIVLPACSILATALSAALNASVAFFV